MKIKVGIFWVVNGKLLTAVEEREATPSNARERLTARIDSRFSHFAVWEKKFGGLTSADFATYPRGRVMFDLRLGSHIVFADKHILKEDILKIKNVFAATKLKRLYDAHYRCDKCLKRRETVR